MYSLNLAEDNRILSACVCLEGFEYSNIVETLPDGYITDYKYIKGEFIHDPDPEPQPDPPEPQPTLEERMDAAESSIDYISMMTGVEIPTEA